MAENCIKLLDGMSGREMRDSSAIYSRATIVL